ncbi:MAG: SH3 domain-containing protein [Clostridia bacterium]|nr:SH3 domain-containing protein [Clostridia bacterium]
MLKRIFAVLLILTLFCATVPLVSAVEDEQIIPQAEEQLMGDLDKDGDVSVEDARIALGVAAGHEDFTALADINNDGVVSIDDVLRILSDTMTSMSDEEYVQFLIESGFPKSYTDGLLELHKAYPEWEFIPFDTTITWSEAVEGEHTPHNKQLIENIVSDNLKCACSSCKGVIQEASNWVSASEEAVEYYLDPRNFFSVDYIFQFETTAYDPAHSIDAVETILKSTWMYNSAITYLDAEGKTCTYKENGQPVKYSQAIMKAAKDSGMSAYFLASKVVQEVGSSTSSYAAGSSGKSAPYNGIYNYYNIGAYTGAGDGLRWANAYLKAKIETPLYSSASTTASKVATVPAGTELNYIATSGGFYKVSATVGGKAYKGFVPTVNVNASTDYGRPWDSPYKSIYYGAKYIFESFSETQFTGYLQKFNVNPNSENMFYHEYMANIRAAAAESQKTYKAYRDSGVLENKKVFSIPVFKDMPNGNLSSADAFKLSKPQVSASATENSVTLSWKAINKAEFYQVWKFDKETKAYKMLKAVSATSFTDTGYSEGEENCYKIRGFYAIGNGQYVFTDYSDEFTARSAPKMPTGLAAESVTDNSIRLVWDGVKADGYNVYRYSSVGGYVVAATVTEPEFYDTSLLSGTSYMYKISAFYKSASMVAMSEQTAALTVKTTGATQLTGVVNVSDSLNIRQSPSTGAAIVTMAKAGQTVLILESLTDWFKIQFTVDGKTFTGYAYADYIKVNKPVVLCPYTEPTVTLRKGDSGESVKWLQWHLAQLGYLSEKDIDGSFGGMTDTAVRNFQTDKKLTVDGLVGSGTRSALKNSL